MSPSTLEIWLQNSNRCLHAISVVLPEICKSTEVIVVHVLLFLVFWLGISAIYNGMRRAHAAKIERLRNPQRPLDGLW
jgi:hypothetical protein